MPWLLTATFFLACLVPSFAQKLPFQGKLLENGQAVNGTKSITFSLTDGSWTETHSVAVTDGLYSVVLGSTTPLPLDIFDYSSERDLSLSVEGEILPNITLYAPLGKFTSVPNNPTGEFVVGQPDTINITAASNATNTNQVAIDSAWQSFTPEKNGSVTQASLYFANFNGTDVRLRIYTGEGLGGSLLYDSVYAASNFTASGKDQVFPLPPSAVSLMATQTYTLQWVGESAKFSMNINESNPYNGGISSSGSGTDLQFEILIDEVIPIAFKSTLNGDVGIGTDNPGARLQVRGEDYSSSTSAFLVTNYLNDTLLDLRNDGSIDGETSKLKVRMGLGEWSPTGNGKNLTINHETGVVPKMIEIIWYSNYHINGNYGKGIFKDGSYLTIASSPYHYNYEGLKTQTSTNRILYIIRSTSTANCWEAYLTNINTNSFSLRSTGYYTICPIKFIWKVYY
ncbi:MAG TPA: hypothetical protein DCP28_31900 [Cytophagales bacterium]|nr:hypothetical protein [Cytophagales bacterium]